MVKCPSPDSSITPQFIQELLRLLFFLIFFSCCTLWGKTFILQVLKIDINSGAITLFQVNWMVGPNGISQENSSLPWTSSWWEPFTFAGKWKCPLSFVISSLELCQFGLCKMCSHHPSLKCNTSVNGSKYAEWYKTLFCLSCRLSGMRQHPQFMDHILCLLTSSFSESLLRPLLR